MCGRYGLWSRKARLRRLLGMPPSLEDQGDLKARYNIAPRTCSWVVLIRAALGAAPAFESYEWGLMPDWAKDRSALPRPINARAETVFQNPMFRAAIRERRCLVPADGYYEWATTPQGKIPHLFGMQSGEPFCFGGIWSHWRPQTAEELPTFALLTTEPNELCATVHDRMPMIVGPQDYALWLDPGMQDRRAIERVLRPFPAELMCACRVSRAVNNSRADGPELIQPRED